jgi:hypothetical protein
MIKKECKCKTAKNIKMSVPEGMEFNTSYTIDSTLHGQAYYETNRNGRTLSFTENLHVTCNKIKNLLIEKNQAYGNTALNPTKIFSKLSSTEAICARIDDKLSRIQNKGINDKTEDTIDDLIGYLLLLKMSLNEK